MKYFALLILSAILFQNLALTANPAIIWGSGGYAENLASSGLKFQSGITVDDNTTDLTVSSDFKITGDTTFKTSLTGVPVLNSGLLSVDADVSQAELGYLDGVTSAIQTQLDAKLENQTLQQAYDDSSDGEIVLDGTRSSVEIRDNSTPIESELLEILSNDSLTSYFSVSSSGINVQNGVTVNSFIDEDNMVSDSVNAVPTQQSVKAYVDSSVAAVAPTIQEVYNNSTDGEIVLDGTRTSLEIRDNATPIGSPLLEVSNNASSTNYLEVTANETEVNGNFDVNGLSFFSDYVGIESAIEFDWISTPVTNPGASLLVYGKSDDQLYKKDNLGVERRLTGNQVQWIVNGHFDTTDDGVNAYADAAGENAVDGTGGSPTVTCTRTTSTSLRGNGSLLLTKDAANRQGEGCSIDFKIDEGYKNNMLTGYFRFDSSSGYADDDIRIAIYDKDNSQLIRVVKEDLKGASNSFKYFQFQATDADDYRLIIHVSSTNASAYTVKFDEIEVAPTRNGSGGMYSQSIFADSGSRATSGIVSNYTIQEQNGGNLLTNSSGTWTVNQNGTVVTATISGNVQSSDSRVAIDFTINGTSYTIGQDAFDNATGYTVSASGTFSLNKDDTLTFETTGNGNVNNIRVSFTAISQGGESSQDLGGGDVFVDFEGNAGETLSSTTDIPFSTENRNIGNLWDGDSLNVNESGVYIISGQIALTASSGLNINLYDGTDLKLITDRQASSTIHRFYSVEYLERGKNYSIRIASGTPTLSNSVNHFINIAKLDSGQSKFEVATVAARYTSDNGQAFANTANLEYEDLDYDTHAAYNTSTGEYTIPETGYYCASASGATDSESWSVGSIAAIKFTLDGTDLKQEILYAQSTASYSVYIRVQDCFNASKGQVLETISGISIAATNLGTTAMRNVFTVARIK